MGTWGWCRDLLSGGNIDMVYGKVTVAEILTQADDTFGRIIEQTQDNAHRNVSPFDEFVRRGFLEDYAADRDYIKRFWIRRILF